MKLIIVPIAALALASCSLEVTREAEPTTTAAPRPAPTTTTTTTLPAPAPATPTAYERDLEYLGNYCWSDCSRAYPEDLDRYINGSTLQGREDATSVLASLTYSELDALCDRFWESPDSEILGAAVSNDVADPFGMLAALWYTCDS